MTPVDAMALVAGVALSFQWRPYLGSPIGTPEPWVMLVIVTAWFSWIGAASTSVVVGARLVRYRRSPRPAEWLAILLTLLGMQAMGRWQPIDRLIGWLPTGLVDPHDTFTSWRWTTAALATLLILAGLVVLGLTRHLFPPWAKSAGLALLADLTLAGPVSTIETEGVNLLAPSGGFGPGLLSMFYWLTCQLVALTPLALILSLPAMAALVERVRRARWRWTEWASLLASILIALCLSPLYRGNFPFPSGAWAAERGLVGAWLVGVGLLSRAVGDRLGPAWSRWLGDQVPASGSPSIAASPESTLRT